MKLTFLGTRGGITVRSRRHYRHSSLLVERSRTRLMVDCGLDWLGRVHALHPTAILLTHAHPDHAAGLAQGATCPVYATPETLRLLHSLPLEACRPLPLYGPVEVDHLSVTAFPVEHSLRAPAVGLRICAGPTCFIYVPDVADIPGRLAVLRNALVYIGDGAVLRRSLIRRRDGALIGHVAVATQLGWCREAGIRHALFTHCGSGIVRSEPAAAEKLMNELGREHAVEAHIAFDGLELSLTRRGIAGSTAPRQPLPVL